MAELSAIRHHRKKLTDSYKNNEFKLNHKILRYIVVMNLTHQYFSIFDQMGALLDKISYKAAIERDGPIIAVS